MAYIEPNTNITVYRNTGLSMSYENTLFFESEDDKDLYWAAASEYIAATFNKCSYQRSERGVIRVEAPIRRLYKADYMRFKNVSYENKFYYAFITHVEYINNETSAIYYVLDPIMTWMGVFTLLPCVVLREHSLTDKVGDSLTDEGMQIADYVTTSENAFPTEVSGESSSIMMSVADEGGNGAIIGGIYSATKTERYATSEEANTRINELVNANQGDNIINIFMCPNEYLTVTSTAGLYDKVFNFTKGYTSFDGYVPKNNKLFTYPYHKLVVSNSAGAEQTYRPEFFTLTSEDARFRVIASVNNGVQVMCIPQNYKGQGNNWEETITLSEFPMCSWGYDSYKAWLAQYNAYYPQNEALLDTQITGRSLKRDTNTILDIAKSVIGGAATGALTGGTKLGPKGAIAGAVTGGMAGALSSTISGASNTMSYATDNAVDRETLVRQQMIYSSEIPSTPQVTKGKVSPNILFAQSAGIGFRLYDKKIQAQQAILIDNYFTMFGYTVNKIETPNMNTRPYYTYVKTCGCIVGGDVPAEDARNIEHVFDTGVRFWKSLSTIGNYQLDNAPSD